MTTTLILREVHAQEHQFEFKLYLQNSFGEIDVTVQTLSLVQAYLSMICPGESEFTLRDGVMCHPYAESFTLEDLAENAFDIFNNVIVEHVQ